MENRRKTVVINPKFQHQYAVVLVAATVLFSNLFLLFRMFFPGEESLDLSPSAALAIGLVELVLVIGVWVLGLRASHRIAGPMFVLTRELRAVGDGDFSARIRLREKDLFQEEAADINASLDRLQQRVAAVQGAAREVQAAQRAGTDPAAAVQVLLQTLDRLAAAGEG